MSGTTNVPSVGVLVKSGTKILLILRENTGFNDGMYVLPSGHVDEGESFTQAAVRELHEEVGLEAAPDNLHHLLTVHRKGPTDIRVDMYFLASDYTGDPQNMEPHVHSEVAWFELSSLPENIADYQKSAIEAIKENVGYEEFGWTS
jgi:ADP-ribose pyrophosphatase YjhB (NUDIX family)